jgi:Glycosyl hydrolase family 47
MTTIFNTSTNCCFSDVRRRNALCPRYPHSEKPGSKADLHCRARPRPSTHRTNVCYSSSAPRSIHTSYTVNSEWRRSAKQDHLVCFLGGSLMLGATTTEAQTLPVSVPPTARELSKTGKRDWTTGFELVNTCVDTYKQTATCVPFIPICTRIGFLTSA